MRIKTTYPAYYFGVQSSSLAEQGENFVGTEFVAGRERHIEEFSLVYSDKKSLSPGCDASGSCDRWTSWTYNDLAGRNGSGLCGEATMPRDNLVGSSRRSESLIRSTLTPEAADH